MGILDRLSGQKAAGSYDLIRELLGRRTTKTGRSVSPTTAIQVATVFACARVIANGIAQVPFKLMRESDDGKQRLPAKDHPLYDILQHRPNGYQTSFEYREMIGLHMVLCGNAYSFINRTSRTGIVELLPFEPGAVVVKRSDTGVLSYEIRGSDGKLMTFPAESIWHIRGPSWNSWLGLEAVQLAREAIGLALAIEEQQSRMQQNGVKASGVYSVEGTLKDDQYKALKAWIDSNIGGVENTGKAMLLDRSAKWLNTSMTGIDAQTLETRRYQVEEICRFALVNPIMVGAESKNTTYASAEQMFLAHVVHCLSPHYQRIEQSANANLLTTEERKAGYYMNFIDAGLMRGSIQTQKDVILGYVNGGVMTPNEGRALLDLNPNAEIESDELRVPANVVGKELPTEPPTPAPDEKKYEKQIELLTTEMKAMRQQPINVDARTTINQAPPAINVTTPEVKAGNVQVDVHIPKQEVPAINVAAPNVKVDVAPTVVNLEATLPTPTVIVSLPNRKTETTVNRDHFGNILTATQTETDA